MYIDNLLVESVFLGFTIFRLHNLLTLVIGPMKGVLWS